MDALEYLKNLPPNPLSPEILQVGYIKKGIAYELSYEPLGMDGEPLWALTIVRDDIPTEDGGVRTGIDHDLSEPFHSERAWKEYLLHLIQKLDPGEKVGPGMP